MRVLELFSGVGAVAAAIGDLDIADSCSDESHQSTQFQTAAAIDINQSAATVYRANFSSPVLVEEVNGLSADRIRDFDCDLWWMSPPCQPYTRRGLMRDVNDTRARPLLHLIEMVRQTPPKYLALENVIGFEDSSAHVQLKRVLEEAGFDVAEINLCSTMFGIPNLRPRFFLAASRVNDVNLVSPPAKKECTVAELLDDKRELSRWSHSLDVPSDLIQKYRTAINVCTPESNVTRCFTSAYGHSVVRSGSYLQTGHGYRRFSPSEVARFLGLPAGFVLPAELTTRQLWKLLGNSVNVPCVRWVLRALLGR